LVEFELLQPSCGFFKVPIVKASTHPEKVSTNISRYLNHFTGGMWVKSSCQSASGREPLAWYVGKDGVKTIKVAMGFLANGAGSGNLL
jgi:hypothetical protein